MFKHEPDPNTVGNRSGQGMALNNIARAIVGLGNPAEGLVYAQRALAIQREIGDIYSAAATWATSGPRH